MPFRPGSNFLFYVKIDIKKDMLKGVLNLYVANPSAQYIAFLLYLQPMSTLPALVIN